MDDDGDLDETGLGEDVPVPGETEAEKRKRRQERHRTLERKRREKTQAGLHGSGVLRKGKAVCLRNLLPYARVASRTSSCGLINLMAAEIEQQTGQRQPGAANFTLNKALNHV
eukprot:437934-Rhodomonas_salina.1